VRLVGYQKENSLVTILTELIRILLLYWTLAGRWR